MYMESSKLRLIDDPQAPEIFSEGASGLFISNGNIHVLFSTLRPTHDALGLTPAVNRVTVCRMVMPVAGAQALVANLSEFLRQHGVATTANPEPVAAQT